MRKFYTSFFVLFLLIFISTRSSAQVVIDNTLPYYFQNFNSGFGANASGYTGTPLGWYTNRAVITGNGSSNTGGVYAFNSANLTSDIAMGGIGSGSATSCLFGVAIKNSTGSTITELLIRYHGEQYRSANTITNTLTFGTQIPYSAITGTFTETYSNLNFVSPNVSAAGSPLDPSLAANSAYKKDKLTVSIATGTQFMLRWKKVDDSGNDQGIGADDLYVVPQPVAKPINLTFTNITQNTSTVSWSHATTAAAPTGYVVFRSSGATNPIMVPVDETAYTVGTTYGANNDKCVYAGTSTTFNETGLAAGTTYRYIVYAYNGPSDLLNYFSTTTANGLINNYTTAAPGNVSNPINFAATPASTASNSTSWTLNAASNPVIVVQSTTSPTGAPTDGASYSVGNTITNVGTVVYKGSGTAYTDPSLTANTTYYYKIYAYDATTLEYSIGSLASSKTYRATSAATDYFKSNVGASDSGAYHSGLRAVAGTSFWQSSEDGSYYINATLVPTSSATKVTIAANDWVVLDQNENISNLEILAGGKLSVPSGKVITFTNTAGYNTTVSGELLVRNTLSIPTNYSLIAANGGVINLNAAIANSGSITANNGGTIRMYGAYTLTNSAGALSVNTGGTIRFMKNATYQHAMNGGTIPAITWDDLSTCYLTGITSGLPTLASQSFYNFTYNCTGNSGFTNNINTLTTVRNKLYIQSTNGTGATLGLFTSAGNFILNIGGDLEVAAGQYLTLNNQNSLATSVTLNIGGNLIVGSGALFRYNFGAVANNTATAIYLDGNLNAIPILEGSGGTQSPKGTAKLVFTAKKVHSILSDVLAPTTIGVNYELADSATLLMSGYSIAGTGGFTATGNCNIKFNHRTSGLAGAIALSGTKSWSSGTAIEVVATGTGQTFTSSLGASGWPATLRKLKLSGNGNTNTFSLSGNLTVTDSLNINNAFKLDLSTYKLAASGYFDFSTGGLTTSSTASLDISETGSNVYTQFVMPSNITALKDLTLNRTNGLILTNNLAISGALTFTKGMLSTVNGTDKYTITLGNAATITETTSAYLKGKVSITRAAIQGSAQSFGGVGVTMTCYGAAAGSVIVDRYTGSDWAPSVTVTNTGNHKTYPSMYMLYDITPTTNSGLNASLSFKYFDTDLNNCDESTLKVYTRHGSSNPFGIAVPGGRNSFNSTTNTIGVTGINQFSEWTFGSSNNPLPVELTGFEARATSTSLNSLNWTTASERNNSGFEVESSENGNTWRNIGFVNGQGSSDETHAYNYEDANFNMLSEVTYYRLKQIDFNGKTEYSDIAKVVRKSGQQNHISAVYNHATESIVLSGIPSGNYTLTDIQGRQVIKGTFQTSESAIPLQSINKGIYFLLLDKQEKIKIIKY